MTSPACISSFTIEGAETEGNITTDAWHTLRLEFYNYASGAGAPIVKVYIDNLYAGYTEATTVKDTTGFRWAGYAGAKFTVYFDNMSMTEKAMPTEYFFNIRADAHVSALPPRGANEL